MIKQKSHVFISAILGLTLLAFIFTSCADEKKSNTETTVTDTMMTPMMDTMAMPVDTMHVMDTATTRPIVPGT